VTSLAELRQRLLVKWRNLDHTVVVAAVSQWCCCLCACVGLMVYILSTFYGGFIVWCVALMQSTFLHFAFCCYCADIIEYHMRFENICLNVLFTVKIQLVCDVLPGISIRWKKLSHSIAILPWIVMPKIIAFCHVLKTLC